MKESNILVRHICPLNPNKTEQIYALTVPQGLETQACYCGWCNNSFRLSSVYHEPEGYQNPFDRRGSFTPKRQVGRFGRRNTFFPLPEREGEWEIIEPYYPFFL